MVSCVTRSVVTRPAWQKIVFRIFAICLGVVALWYRKPQSFYRPQVWAEDGSVFFSGAYRLGLESLLERYAGYYHTLPRLVAILTEALMPLRAPEVFVAVYLVFFVWIAWLMTGGRLNLRYSFFFPILLVFAAVDSEPFMNLANLQWILAWLSIFVLCAAAPSSRWQRLHDLSLVTLVGLSSLFAVFFAPLFALKLWRERSRFSFELFVINSACALLQVLGFSSVQRAPAVSNPIYFDLLSVVGRPWHSLLFGPFEPLTSNSYSFAWVLGVATVLALLLLLVFAYRKRNSTALFMVSAACLMWVVVLLSISGNPTILLAGGARYLFLQPLLMLVAVFGTGLFASRFALGIVSASLLLVALHIEQYRERPWPDIRWRRNVACLFKSAPHAEATPQVARVCRIILAPPGWFLELPAR